MTCVCRCHFPNVLDADKVWPQTERRCVWGVNTDTGPREPWSINNQSLSVRQTALRGIGAPWHTPLRDPGPGRPIAWSFCEIDSIRSVPRSPSRAIIAHNAEQIRLACHNIVQGYDSFACVKQFCQRGHPWYNKQRKTLMNWCQVHLQFLNLTVKVTKWTA